MTLAELGALLRRSPIIASAQASPGSPLDTPDSLSGLAAASVAEGVLVLRMQGVASIHAAQASLSAPIIGLVKATYPESEVYITPTSIEVKSLLALGCPVIALDGTRRQRPGNEELKDLIHLIHVAGKLAMADCDTIESARFSREAGADIISTTLSGYTADSTQEPGPDIELVRNVVKECPFVIAEGRFSEPWHVSAALRAGAKAVVIGGALNDPMKQTRKFVKACAPVFGPVGAVDIGGTFMRFGVFSEEWKLLESIKVQTLQGRQDRLDWIARHRDLFGASRIGIGTGGTVDPASKVVWEAKPLIPHHASTDFSTLGDVVVLNDGMATAWGHACLPEFAGTRVASLALGTGVGFGWVDRGRIMMGARGEYPRLNDLELELGTKIEDILGGLSLGPDADTEQKLVAQDAASYLLNVVRTLLYPDHIVVCGGVGLAPWMTLDATKSPFGPDAGLYGAAALALYPQSD